MRGWALRRLDRRRARDERGAVAIMMALTLTAVLIGAAMVIDFGLARYDRALNKSTADSAALAGASALDQLDGSFHPWKGVCAALAYIQANDQELGTVTGTYKNGSGSGVGGTCSGTSVPNDTVCVANTPGSWAWFHGTALDGRYTIDIKSGYTTPDANWPEDTAFTTDNSKLGGCDQLAVILQETKTPGLGSLATDSDLVTNVRSVARLTPSTTGEVPIALLLLERHNCLALQAGSNNTYFDVLGFGTASGLIHADSLGDQTGTGSDCNSDNKVIDSKFSSHIIARHSESGGFPGLITTAAANSGLAGAVPANATSGSVNVCAEQANGSCAAGTGANFIGRTPIDTRYLTGVRNWMSDGTAKAAWSTTTANANGYTVWNAGSCNNLQTSDMPAAVASKALVYVNCTSGSASFKNFTFANATNVIFNSSVSINSGQTLSIPKAQTVYVRGNTSSHIGINAQGNLSLQTGAAASCSAATPTARNKVVIANGSFTGGASSSFHMCFTTVLMAEGWNGSACPVPSTPTPVTSEPYDNTCYGYISLGGGGTMDWTAPNLITTKANSTAWDDLEDLTLWTESSGLNTTSTKSSIGGGGTMTLSGVLFLPNANPFIISGGGFQSNGADAQFITRRLSANGQGTLYMRPNPSNAITIPAAATYALVR